MSEKAGDESWKMEDRSWKPVIERSRSRGKRFFAQIKAERMMNEEVGRWKTEDGRPKCVSRSLSGVEVVRWEIMMN